MAGRVTMADVAARAGVSAKTVSNVLGGSGAFSAGTEARVRAAADELGYRLHTGAQRLRSRRSGTIALALPTLRQPIDAALAQAVLEAADDVPVLLELTRGEARLEEDVLAGRLAQEADGVLYVPQALDATALVMAPRTPAGAGRGTSAPGGTGVPDGPGSPSAPERAEAAPPAGTVRRMEGPPSSPLADRPVVVIGGRPARAADQVRSAVAEQVALTAAHLAALGRSSPAVVGVADDAEGWTSACVLGLGHGGEPVPAERVVRVGDAATLRSGVEAVLRMLRSGVRFDSLVCHNDALAAGATGALLRHGARVPGDVAVVGRGDTEVAVFASPPLTSVSPGLRAVARAAVDLLLARLQPGAGTAEPVHVPVTPTLTVRASTWG